jgi:uncharacterized surface protein with fasciclin (FAS1) repeats
MRISGVIILAMLGSVMVTLRAQDAAPPSVDLYSEQTQPEATVAQPQEPNGPDVPELSQLDQTFKQHSLGKAADERRVHVEWRRLKNQVENDPSVRAAEAATHTTHTDLEKRQRLRNYYDLYYGRMAALASTPEMKLALEALKNQHVNQTSQPKVRPSPSASPTPEAVKVAHLNRVNAMDQPPPEPLPSQAPSPSPRAERMAAIEQSTRHLNTFLKALATVQNAVMSEDNSPITLFAPTDRAFAKLPPGMVENLLKPENKAKLTSLLAYHIMRGVVSSGELATEAPTLLGPTLNIKVANAKITVNDAHVIEADVKVPNGVIHVIDKVLIPPNQ